MRKFKLLTTILILILLISGCDKVENKESDFQIVTTLFPQYDILSRIIKDKGEVSLLIAPGSDAHSFEPTPKDITKLLKSDLFVYTSDEMEVYAKGIVESVESETLRIINIGEHLGLNDSDPHFWLDPIIASDIVEYLVEEVILLDPDNKDFYLENANVIINQLNDLHIKYLDVVEHSKNDTLVFAGHFAFDYFIERYNLRYISPYKNFSESAEASIKNVTEIINFIKAENIKTIYFEELVDPKLAEMIAAEVDVNTLKLHAAHNISKVELESNVSFIDILYENLENLKIGLEYE